ncbi:uncharacterized protein LACBIDRAFT_294095 [Laccaria bicolor S238N-H82]|uniref:Predicted protein n=1 Tax=Laccaria bicolor (strain S238N-H82 / ATCC MYA-4686) TaxID=486041 RepID=B0D939_LACBS|nr:uncharacterized protein LACBIDRAFT_294095 [Laccaria bicolor S238N-H82]EDR09188.1 predicted protein [Laccaria bicolor S238N-H82]|eukprot:XP_001880501.1 predicted protein [Laccaria bicolor S238N-H82]
MFNDMPSLVDDPNPPFIPPPAGASTGGQPGYSGYSNPFPGASASNWPGTPYPRQSAPLAPPPTSAQSWTFGQTNPWSAPAAPTTPAGTWGGMTPAGSLPQTPYTPYSNAPPASAPAGHYPPFPQPNGYPPFSQPNGYPPSSQPNGYPPSSQPNGYPPFSQPNVGHYPQSSQPNVDHYPPISQHHTGYPLAPKEDQSGWFGSSLGMKRSNSYQGYPKRPGGLGASGGGLGVGGYPSPTGGMGMGGYPSPAGTGPGGVYLAYGEGFDERNLARRPRDWRADYNARQGISSFLPRVGRSRSDVQEFSDPTRRILHPLLQYTPTRPSIYHDLRDDPLKPNTLEFLNLQRPPNDIDYAQLATQPPSSIMRIYHPLLPWYIDVQKSHTNGITVFDVLTQIWQQLHTAISNKHYWNEELGAQERAALNNAFWERCRGVQEEISRGIMRIDFLGRKIILMGFVKGKNGMWEMKTRKDDSPVTGAM